MKSIIEQASSIMKAIEKAWNQAEQPKEFSIKIFEKEERNFFGMTSKPAKIGIFFGDKPIIHEKPAQKPRPEIKECRPAATSRAPQGQSVEKSSQQPAKPHPAKRAEPQLAPTLRPNSQQKQSQPTTTLRPLEKKAPVSAADTTTAAPEKPRKPVAWNDAMIAATESWLKKTLELMHMNSIHFTAQVAGKNLKLMFNLPLVADTTHEKQLFRSLAHLIMSSLRTQYKQEIKDLKVILISAAPQQSNIGKE